jgi:hypothetical protein
VVVCQVVPKNKLGWGRVNEEWLTKEQLKNAEKSARAGRGNGSEKMKRYSRRDQIKMVKDDPRYWNPGSEDE